MRLLLSQNNLIVQDLEIFKNIKKNKKNYYLYFSKKKSLKEKNLIYYNSIDLLTKINIAIIMGIFLIVSNIIIYQEKSKRFIKRYKKKQKDLNNKFDLITQKEILIKLNNYEETDSKKYCYSTIKDFYNEEKNIRTVSEITGKKLNLKIIKEDINLINYKYSKYLKLEGKIKIEDDILLKYAVKKYLTFNQKIYFIILSLTPNIVKKKLRLFFQVNYRTPINKFSTSNNYLKTIFKNVFKT
jgi:hypothetical protein